MIKLIALVDNNYVIGSTNTDDEDNWDIDHDSMNKFYSMIMGKKILMGSLTFIRYTEYQLTGYQEILVLTKNPKKFANPKNRNLNVKFISDSNKIKQTYKNNPNDDIFIIGGAKVWKEFIAVANEIYLIITNNPLPTGDLFFPVKDLSHFKLIKKEKVNTFTFETYHKK